MSTRPKTSEANTLEQYRVSLENTELQPQIASTMAEYGYDSTKVAEGKALYETTRLSIDSNKIETDEEAAAYAIFQSKKDQLADIYSDHRKKAKVVFRDDAVTADKLEISGSLPQAYVKWIETVRKFYNIAIKSQDIQIKLSRLKITLADLTAAQALIPEVESTRAAFLKEKGESQDATTIKDTAFAKLDDWMSEFYAVAKIAMEDNPQLLEALGKVIKS
jgi:GTP1/Obg family GTP-binding protein